jgi:hypothetical protein
MFLRQCGVRSEPSVKGEYIDCVADCGSDERYRCVVAA